jgi:catechol 2,3-dioxygenase-like lactoylglutathione lyase family enzyme
MRMLRTAYTISDMDRSLAFYRDLLGLRVVRDKVRSGESYEQLLGVEGVNLRVALLEDGTSGHLLELVQYLQPAATRRVSRETEVGASTMCFIVDDLSATYERLRGAGVRSRSAPAAFIQEGRQVGRIVAVFDPDEIPVVLLEKVRS